MNGGDFLFEHRVDKSMPRKGALLLKLGRYNDCLKHLTTTTWKQSIFLLKWSKPLQSIPDISSISTRCAPSLSVKVVWRDSDVTPVVLATVLASLSVSAALGAPTGAAEEVLILDLIELA